MKPLVIENWMWRDKQSCLGVDIYDRSNRYNYTIKFCRLANVSGNKGSENSLHEGRFHSYTKETQSHGIQLRVKNKDQFQLNEWFTPVLYWLAENSEKWSLDIVVNDVHDIEFNFGFEEVATAVIFGFLFR